MLCCTVFVFCGAYAQKSQPRVLSQTENGIPNHIVFDKTNSYQKGEINQLFEQQLATRSDDEFVLLNSKVDNLGFEHLKFQQYHKGIRVEFSTYTVHLDRDGVVKSITGEMSDASTASSTASISESVALSAAINYIGAKEYLWQQSRTASVPKGELVYLDNPGDDVEETELAYKFDVYATEPISRADIYVSANTGEILFVNSRIRNCHHKGCTAGSISKETKNDIYTKARSFVTDAIGLASTRYSGNRTITTDDTGASFRLRDYSRGNGVLTFDMNTGVNYGNAVDFIDNDNSWTNAEWDNAQLDNGALDAHWGAEMTYDYFLNEHGRNSFDDNGAAIQSFVHFGNSFDNAFWDGQRMTYGDGNVFDILTSIDIVAHEIGHAVCEHTADLVYARQYGALNEGLSDIWGACVERFADPSKSTWELAEEIGGPLRSMSNPNSEGQPDTYKGDFWDGGICIIPSQSNDYCGVHTNSGVLNFMFYLLTEGGIGTNDNGDNYSVNGIGIQDAAQIIYRMETVYLWNKSKYKHARDLAIESAIDIFGYCSTQHRSTQNAFHAVGIGERKENCCDTSDSADFTVEINCHNGNWQVNVIADDFDPANHWWGLMETDTQGEVSDANTIGQVGPIQGGLTASFSWLDISKRYYIKHGIWQNGCYSWREKRIPVPTFETNPVFHFENSAGVSKTSFCNGEDIYLDGTASTGENRFHLSAWRKPIGGGSFSWYGSIGWTYETVEVENLTDLFGAGGMTFTQGYEYKIKLATANPSQCRVWTEVLHTFTVECCDPVACFYYNTSGSSNSSTFNLSLSSCSNGFDHNNWWFLLKSTSASGSWSWVDYKTSVGTASVTFNNLAKDSYYKMVHYVEGACSNYVYEESVFYIQQGKFSGVGGIKEVAEKTAKGSLEHIRQLETSYHNVVKGGGIEIGTEVSELEPIRKREINSISSFKVFPNPANDIVNISLRNVDAENLTVNIFTLTGKRIYQRNLNILGQQFDLALTNIPSGLYLVQINDDKNVLHTQKLSIIK